MTLVRVPENRTEEFFTKFFANSCFTFEGIDLTNKKNNEDMEKAFRDAGYENEDFVGYWFKGKDMNEVYHLTGDNAYRDNLTFLVVEEFYNPFFKMCVGARWFDDVVQKNEERQKEINKMCGGN